jgi:hypothetical protein
MKTTMNWSLKPISKISFLLVLFLIGNQTVFAQSKTKLSYGISVNGGFGGTIANQAAYQNYIDTINSNKSAHLNKGVHLWMNYSLGKKYDLQMGLGFQQNGFARKQSNLNFQNYTYPGIGTGRIEDFSNSTKEITYNYRFSYLQIPVLFNSYLGRSADFKWVYLFSLGITPQILLNHQIVANCNPGFSIEGEKQFKLDSTGFDARILVLNLQAGLNFEYHSTKNKTYFIQPLIGFYPISVSSSKNTSNPFYFSVNVGVLLANLSNAAK